MKLSELSRAARVPSSTVKWYLRVGLLPRGSSTAVNQASYGQQHLRRLVLVRTLIEVGGLSVAATRAVVDALDDPGRSLHDVIGVAHSALSTPADQPVPDEAAELVDTYLDHRGWRIRPDSPLRTELAAVLAAIGRLAQDGPAAAPTPATDTAQAVARLLDPYADAVEPLAAAEVAGTGGETRRDRTVEWVVAGTVLMERALVTLRRIAQEHHSRLRHAPDAAAGPSGLS